MEDASTALRRIRQLPEQLILKMAAGEVVERPASVVKELCENAVDAGARRVDVRVERAGMELISVIDDGSGIDSADLRLAVGRHATSKIADEGHLDAIATLGFRGEALSSAAAVARLEIVSRVRGRPMGARIRVEGSEVLEETEAGAPEGTQVSVRDLFFNTPARRKFMRSPQTELAHVIDAVSRVALGFPGIHFTLAAGGRSVLDCPPATDPTERALQVLGDEARGHLFTAKGGESGMALTVVATDPGVSRGTMSSIYVLINDRHVLDKGVRRVVGDAFRHVLPGGRYPLAVLRLEVPRSDVDVNVHPQKSEVRFVAPGRVYGFVSKVLTDALAGAPWIQGTRAAPSPGHPTVQGGGAAPLVPRQSWEPRDYAARPVDAGAASPSPSYWPSAAGVPSPAAALPFAPDDAPSGFFSSRVYRGQVWEMYLVFEGPSTLVFVDQHAAHERIAFQKMMDAHRAGKPSSQMLLLPQEAELSPRHTALVERHLETLASMGIRVEPFGGGTFMVRGLPLAIAHADPRAVVADLVDELEAIGAERSLTAVVAHVASRVACHAVVRGRHALSAPEAAALAKNLDRCDFGAACPHGRPVWFELTRTEVEKRFGRQ